MCSSDLWARAVIPTIIAQALERSEIRLGSLEPRRDLTFVEDTVSGFIAAATRPEATGRTIQLGTGTELSVGELVQTVGDLLGKELVPVGDSARVRPQRGEVDRLISDPSLARELLGWSAQTEVAEGLRRTITWIDANRGRFRPDTYAI